MMTAAHSSRRISDPTSAEPEVKFITPMNDLFYSSSLYRPLQTQKQEIRLLRILPSPASAQLQCEIVHNVFLLEQPQEYHALSYCAGDAAVVDTIKVHNINFNVFSNLGAGLRKVRKSDEPLDIWVDQICINQKDAKEREAQVLMMRSIYANASKTIVWLGEEKQDHAEGLAVSFLHSICEKARAMQVSEHGEAQRALSKLFRMMKEQNPNISVPNDTPTCASYRSLVFNKDLLAQQAASLSNELRNGNYSEAITATATMYQMPWWTRCWVHQEVICSKSVNLLYGNSVIDFEALRLAHGVLTLAYRRMVNSIGGDTFDDNNFEILFNMAEIRIISKLIELEEKWKTRKSLRIREVLSFSRERDSTDSKDRVYAVLGLIDPAYNIIPNYTPSYSTAQCFITAAKTAIQKDGVLDIIADCHERKRNQSLDLPSWVPDFTASLGHFPMVNWELEDGVSQFDASLHNFLDENPLLKGLPSPEFLSDKDGRPDRILRCVMLDLGHVALDTSIDNIPDTSVFSADHLLHYSEMVETAGLRDVYPSTMEGKPDVPLNMALLQTLACGASPVGVTMGDRDIGFGDAEVRKTFFMDRYMEVTQFRRWRFFITPNKIMGVAPVAARSDDTLCLLVGGTVPFILRRVSEEGTEQKEYKLIGPAYLHGYMSGQAIVEIFKGKRGAKFDIINIH